MGYSIIVPNADFSANGIAPNNSLSIVPSAEGVRSLKVDPSVASAYGGYSQVLLGGNYAGYCYAINVRRFVGKQISITFCVGYGGTILANGGFIASLPSGVDVSRAGWSPTAGNASNDYATQLSFISTVGSITSEESNTWVTKTYTVPQGAKYLLFTSKYLAGGTAGAELVEEAES